MMWQKWKGIATFVVFVAAMTLASGGQGATIEDFYGTYIGQAEVLDADGNVAEEREMDIVIGPARGDGFQVTWINVSLVNGRRDVPGVVRRVQEAMFQPTYDGTYYVAVPPHSVFDTRPDLRLLDGRVLRWASIDGDTLRVNSFQVLEDGRFEIQTYDRTLTDIGIDLSYRRNVNGTDVRRITGHTVRSGNAPVSSFSE